MRRRQGWCAAIAALVLVVALCGVAAKASIAGSLRSSVDSAGCSDHLPSGSVVGMADSPGGGGYWIVDRSGHVAACGSAPNLGSLGFTPADPVVGMAATPDGNGYWLIASDGGVFSFGDAPFYGSTGGMHLNMPMVGMAVTPDGHGYWLVAADGGVFSFGDAPFDGSCGSMRLNEPVVGMSSDTGTGGYWLVAADGGIFTFDAPFDGSTGGIRLNEPVVAMAPDPVSGGYWLVAADGGVFAFDAPFLGSAVAPPPSPLPAAPACAANMANPTPPQYSDDTVSITSNVAGASAVVAVVGGTASQFFDVGTDDGGDASLTFGVGPAIPGQVVAVRISVDGGLAGCSSSYTASVPQAASVTPDGTGYEYSHPQAGVVDVTAPPTSGGNEREFFWSAGSPFEADSTVCGTFETGEGIDQQGVVLRLNDTDGFVTGITVTRNIFDNDFQDFNFHVWNTSRAGQPFTQFGQTVLPFLPPSPSVYPLSMCARTLASTNQVQFVVWTSGQSQPGWGDPTRGGQATIPAGAPGSGQGGFFAAHLLPGSDMTFTDLTIDGDLF